MIDVASIVAALDAERTATAKGAGFTVATVERSGPNVVVTVKAMSGGRGSALDEAIEESRAVWGDQFLDRGEVLFVDGDAGRIVLRHVVSTFPAPGETIRVYPPDFLTPLIELWNNEVHARRALSLLGPPGAVHTPGRKPPGSRFIALREGQAAAIAAAVAPRTLLIGPPGTGKTYTVGALATYLLARFKGCRILVVGPTNMAVDATVLAIDEWLARIGRDERKAGLVQRVGTRFDARKYRGRDHLLAPGVYEAAMRVAALDLAEPGKSDIAGYAAWKLQTKSARSALRSNVMEAASSARILATTVASAVQWYDLLKTSGRWDFVIADEASQITLPAALMLGALGVRTVYAGDPNQLAPVVQSPSRTAQAMLTKTAFDKELSGGLSGAQTVQLDEQSRMAGDISRAVGETFYQGRLRVCSRASALQPWQAHRSPFYVDGRQVPHVYCDIVPARAVWSADYGGFVRFGSADAVERIVAAFLAAGAGAGDILVLTPFRAQRALMKSMLKARGAPAVRVSTVHRAQGSESRIVVFDPVDARGKFLNSQGGRRLINVAVSRAEAHVVLVANDGDLDNPWINRLFRVARSLTQDDGYPSRFTMLGRQTGAAKRDGDHRAPTEPPPHAR